MPSLESARPIIATTLLALYLPVPPYLLLLHGLNRLWRRLGLWSYAILLSAYALMVVATILLHRAWSVGAWEWPEWTAAVALPPLAVTVYLAVVTYRTIEPGTLHLTRQIDPSRGRHLITDGILGRLRHPRYAMFTLIGVVNLIVTGYPLVAASVGLTACLFVIVIRLEESELEAYFGESFRDYKRRVPALVPRCLTRRPGDA